MTKSEFYGKLIGLQKKTGQGLGKLFATMAKGQEGEAARMYLDELEAEGLISCHHDGTSIGHPDGSKWYVPTSGYNVWTDWDHGSSFAGGNLDLVRYYLGAMNHDTEPEGREDAAKYLHPSAQVLTQHPGFMMRYAKWLEKNHEALEEMKNLSDIYPGVENQLSEEALKLLKSREWYKNNSTVSECIEKCKKGMDNEEEIIRTTNRILDLMGSTTGYDADIKKYKSELEETKAKISTRKSLLSFLMGFDGGVRIQETIKD